MAIDEFVGQNEHLYIQPISSQNHRFRQIIQAIVVIPCAWIGTKARRNCIYQSSNSFATFPICREIGDRLLGNFHLKPLQKSLQIGKIEKSFGIINFEDFLVQQQQQHENERKCNLYFFDSYASIELLI